MKTKLLLIITFFYFSSQAQITLIPDSNFEQALIDQGIDVDGTLNGEAFIPAIEFVQFLDVSDSNISDLSGIEDFVGLIVLQCRNNQISSLDVSNNTQLESLSCDNNQLVALDLSGNLQLNNLICWNNQLTTLNLSQNNLLETLACSGNMLTGLNLNPNAPLEFLQCFDNQLSSLDISSYSTITDLQCGNNNIVSINGLTNNIQLTRLEVNDNLLTNLDVSSNLILEVLRCSNNDFNTLNVSNNTLLERIQCSNNNSLTNVIGLNALNELTFFTANNTSLTSLDFSDNELLEVFQCFNSSLSELNLKNQNNLLINSAAFDISSNPNLFCVDVDDSAYSTANWLNKDAQTVYSEDCATLSNTENVLTTFKVYPNPTRDYLSVELMDDFNYTITDLKGNLLIKGELFKSSNTIQVSELAQGVYFINLQNNKAKLTKKIIIN